MCSNVSHSEIFNLSFLIVFIIIHYVGHKMATICGDLCLSLEHNKRSACEGGLPCFENNDRVTSCSYKRELLLFDGWGCYSLIGSILRF